MTAHSHVAIPSRRFADTVPRAPEGALAPGAARSFTIDVDGRTRRFVVRLPRAAGEPRCTVLAFHGSTSYPEEQLALGAMGPAADAYGMALVLPEATERVWNVPHRSSRPQEAPFVAAVLDRCVALFGLDRERVFATGFSGGGRLACALTGSLPGWLAAIAPVGGLRPPAANADRVPVLATHGTGDPVSPYEGGGPWYWGSGVDHAVGAWARHLGCDRLEIQVRGKLTRIRHHGPGPGITLEVLEGLGHQWPGSPVDLGFDFGPPAPYHDTTGRAFAFFESVASSRPGVDS